MRVVVFTAVWLFGAGVEGVDFGVEAGLPMFFTALTSEFHAFCTGWITFCWTTVFTLFNTILAAVVVTVSPIFPMLP